MEFFETLVNGWKPLSNATKSSILDEVKALVMPQNNAQKQPWWAIPSCTCTLLILGKKSVTEVEDFKLICLDKPILEIALAPLNHFCGDKIKITNEEVFKL